MLDEARDELFELSQVVSHIVLVELSAFVVLHVGSNCKFEKATHLESMTHLLDVVLDFSHLGLDRLNLLVLCYVVLFELCNLLGERVAESLFVLLGHQLQLLVVLNLSLDRVVLCLNRVDV